MRDPQLVAGLARGEDGLRRAAGAVGVRAFRVDPEPQRDADRLRAGAEERDGAVDAAAHRYGDAVRIGRRPEDRAERVRERVHGELVAADGGRLQQRQTGERPIEPLGVGTDDAVAVDGEPHQPPLAAARGISDDFDHAVTVDEKPA